MISPVTTIVIDWLLVLVTYLICGVRLYVIHYSHAHSSRKQRRRWDTEVILCSVLAIGTASVCVDTWKCCKLIQLQRRAGPTGEDDEDRREMAILQNKVIYAQSFAYYVVVWLIKAAFLSTYFHFREKISKRCRYALYVLTALVAISFVVITLMMFLICLPLERTWSLGRDSCSPQSKIWNHSKTAACNILTDLFLIGLFLAILRRLHLGRRERWGVIFFLTVSAVPVLAAILRLVIIVAALKRAGAQVPPAQREVDVRRFQDVLYLASEVEVTTAFIAACLPAMRALFRQKHETRQYANSANEYKASRGSSGGGGGGANTDSSQPPGTPRFDAAGNTAFLSASFDADDHHLYYNEGHHHNHHNHRPHHQEPGGHYDEFDWGTAAEGGGDDSAYLRAHDIELQVHGHHDPHRHHGHSTPSGQMGFPAPTLPAYHGYPVGD